MTARRALPAVLTALLLAGLSVPPAGAAQIIVGNLGFEKIPAGESRRVLGTWLMKTLGCTRSIEEVGQRYFMVSRCKDKREGGDGLPLRKVSAVLYEGLTTGWSYTINENGVLIMRSRRGSEYVGEPHGALWP